MSRVFIFFFLIVDVLGSDSNISCYPMGDEDYYGTVRKHEINCFTIPVHFQKINFTIKAPDDGPLTLLVKVCNSTETSPFKIEPNTTTPFTLDSKYFQKEKCEDRKRIDEIEVRVMMFHSNSTNSSDSASLSFQIINNNKIGIFTATFFSMIFYMIVIAYMLAILCAVLYLCSTVKPDTPRQDETGMNDLNSLDETEMNELNSPDGIEMDNLNRADETEMNSLNGPNETEMVNLNRPDETEMENLNRPDETEMNDPNSADETEMNDLKSPDEMEIDDLNRPDDTEMDNLNNTLNNN